MEGIRTDRIHSVHSSVPLVDILRPALSGGRIAVAVDHSAPFANFRYVEGVPSAQDGTGYPMSKLQALDVLIGRLVAMRQEKAIQGVPDSGTDLSDQELDTLIKDLGTKLNTAISTSITGLQDAMGISMGPDDHRTGVILNAWA